MKNINKKIIIKKSFGFLMINPNDLKSVHASFHQNALYLSISHSHEERNYELYILKFNVNMNKLDEIRSKIKEKIINFLYKEILEFNSNKEEILNLSTFDYQSLLDEEIKSTLYNEVRIETLKEVIFQCNH